MKSLLALIIFAAIQKWPMRPVYHPPAPPPPYITPQNTHLVA